MFDVVDPYVDEGQQLALVADVGDEMLQQKRLGKDYLRIVILRVKKSVLIIISGACFR